MATTAVPTPSSVLVEADQSRAPALVSRGVDVCVKLARENPHPRDAAIVFQEEGHTYLVDGVPVGLSVTGLIASVDPEPFDAVKAAQGIVRMSRPHPRYSKPSPSGDGTVVSMTAEEIQAEWLRANVLGTDLHGKIERHLNGLPVTFAADGANAVEFEQFSRWFRKATEDGYVPYRTEWVIYDTDVDVAGSVDFVMRHTVTGDVCVVDWKRCLTTASSGFFEAYRDKRLLPPLHAVPSTKLNKWRLQVNVYRAILERHYGLKVSKMMMVVCHSTFADYEEYVHAVDTSAETLLSSRAPGVYATTATIPMKRPRVPVESDAEEEDDNDNDNHPHATPKAGVAIDYFEEVAKSWSCTT